MAVDLLLVRHGNTFEAGQKVRWCGARTDLALTQTGLEQAQTLARTYAAAGIKPLRLLVGPLLRTRQHGDILAEALLPGLAPEIADTIREIDYGAWEGLSTAEITSLGGGDELAAWDKHAKWPNVPGWSPGEADILASVETLLTNLRVRQTPGPVIIVTSNGILRFFARCAANPPTNPDLANPDMKVRTGHHCRMTFDDGAWKVLKWNLPPDIPPLHPRG